MEGCPGNAENPLTQPGAYRHPGLRHLYHYVEMSPTPEKGIYAVTTATMCRLEVVVEGKVRLAESEQLSVSEFHAGESELRDRILSDQFVHHIR
ncbi:uncharacterized protein BP01DRAFT_387437 [Aspergillus saccharolyticus JOP 1030-1]|uniref:Uncharacterized protein n=1 Tax=Aspergillus saccharolyticus JOP 1030-1 TaxID=1450539 RepID=A0A318Z9Z4_9EURO|nr:hypothetical protein BP01DRAFT_387437 [Aspergillus saccharolyticus JOP 1030-1]PYH40330.1 hypothetical protein BP01DRAFT_387437 [Aspergillus saccharolyticus JOP 1030-1]